MEHTNTTIIVHPNTSETRPESDASPIRLLHLSDLHFTEKEDVVAVLQPLVDDLKDQHGGLGFTRLDFLIISGDFTNRASPEEFKLTRKFIAGLVDEFMEGETGIKNCIIVPGNHDLSWEEEVYEWKPERRVKAEELADESFYIKQGNGYLVRKNYPRYQQRFKNFSEYLYQPLFDTVYPLDEHQQCLQSFFPTTQLQWLALNSSWQIDEFFPKRSGILGGALAGGLKHADEELTKNQVDREAVLRIAVLHHPVSGQDGFIEQLQKAGVSVILHGHVHEERADLLRFFRPPHIYAIGAGSFGAPTNARPESTPLSYNVLEIQRDFSRIRVHTRCRRKQGSAWEGWTLWPGEHSTERRTYYEFSPRPSP